MEELGREALYKLIEFIESASPRLWEIAMRQVAVDLARYWVAAGVTAIALVVAAFSFRWAERSDSYPNEDIGYGAALGLLIISLPLFVLSIMEIIGRTMNPEYYAIRVLMGFLK